VTNDDYREKIMEQMGRFFFATNTPFTHVEHPEFIKFVSLSRPGYKPPNRKWISNEILDDVHTKVVEKYKHELSGQPVTMFLDDWSNVHNEPIVCSCAVLPNGDTYLIDSFDTCACPHTAENLADLAKRSVLKCQCEYGASVHSFVRDNHRRRKGSVAGGAPWRVRSTSL